MVEASASGSGRVVAGRYRILRELGRGGMGVVWLAADELIGRQVALKELRAPGGLTSQGLTPQGLTPQERAGFAQRALAEARNAARVRHPNAVALYDAIPASEQDDAVYLVMEPVEARSLDKVVLAEGRVSEQRAAAIALQLLDVLDAAHALGVVHRDVKPANILLGAGDVVKLADFGIAHSAADPRLTGTGLVAGTPAYMAPEAYRGGPITAAADRWSLGACLYFAVEGAHPFQRETTAETLGAILFEDLPEPTCARPLADVIRALLVRDPARRATSDRVRAVFAADGPTLLGTRVEDQSTLLESALARTVEEPPHPERALKGKALFLGSLVAAAALAAALIFVVTHVVQHLNPSAAGSTTTDTTIAQTAVTAVSTSQDTTSEDTTTEDTTSEDTAASKDTTPAHGALATGPHFLVNGATSGCLDQDYHGGIPHPDIVSFPCNHASNESWDVQLNSDGSYSFVNAATGGCLNQDYSDGAAHTDVIAYPCGSNENQDWKAVQLDGSVFLQNEQSGGCLDQDYGSGTPALDVLANSPCNYAPNEAWSEQ